MPELTREQIEKKKKARAMEKRLMIDRLRFYLGVSSPFLLTCMVIALIFSAQVLEESKLAVVTGLISTISISLLSLLHGISVPHHEDPMASLSKELVEFLKKSSAGTEVRMDKNYVSIGKDGHSKVVTSNDKDLFWGNDPLKKDTLTKKTRK